MPGLAVLRSYRGPWLLRDGLAGLVLAAILLTAGMGYAQAAGLPAINGLYATIPALVAYALFGPSRILVLGPDSALAALIAATVLPLAAGDPAHAVALAGMLALLCGGLCLIAGLARVGFITELISKPIRYGYLNGLALTVLVGQLPQLLGFAVGGHSLLTELVGLGRGGLEKQVNTPAAAIGLGSLVLILALKRWRPAVPGALVAVVLAEVVLALLPLDVGRGVAVVGRLPQGLPPLAFPAVTLAELRALAPGALAIALVAFADTSVLPRTLAQRSGQSVDSNQELIGLGLANAAAGMFQGFAVSSSTSRTPVAEAAGARSQVTGLVGAPNLVAGVPTAALGAVVIIASLALAEARGVRRLYQLRSSEFLLSMLCFFGVALLGVIQGIFAAISVALLAFIWRAWRPCEAVLGRVDGLKGYHDVSRHPEGRRIPGLVLYRWDAPLFFANADLFRERVLQAVAEAPTPTRWVVVAAEPITDVDITAADMLSALDGQLHAAGMDLCFAEMKGQVKDRLKRYGLFQRFGSENFFPTLGQAVDRYLGRHRVTWCDWDKGGF
ncbi:SulP family inorganic anion transporter [Cyanobium sp. Morenito 9A2]|nr:SulP family inorganic anion transporter [Cyanobium sp. Morenito 9A2]